MLLWAVTEDHHGACIADRDALTIGIFTLTDRRWLAWSVWICMLTDGFKMVHRGMRLDCLCVLLLLDELLLLALEKFLHAVCSAWRVIVIDVLVTALSRYVTLAFFKKVVVKGLLGWVILTIRGEYLGQAHFRTSFLEEFASSWWFREILNLFVENYMKRIPW